MIHREYRFGNIGRAQVRHATVLQALAMLQELGWRTNAGRIAKRF